MVKAICRQIGKRPGDAITVEVWMDDALREVEIPVALEKLLKKEGLMPFFEGLSFTHRKEYCWWLSKAKKEETRMKRLAAAMAILKKGVLTP